MGFRKWIMEVKEWDKCAAALTGWVCREYELSCDVHGENTEKELPAKLLGRNGIIYYFMKRKGPIMIWFGLARVRIILKSYR